MNWFISKYSMHKETLHNIFWRTLQILGKQGVVFFIFIICAKILSQQDFGIYNYILAAVFLLIMIGDFGISTATSKYVAEYEYTDKEKIKSVLVSAGSLVIGITFIVVILSLLFGRYILGDKFSYFLFVLPMVLLVPLTSLLDGVYRGLKKFKKLSIISIIVGLLSVTISYFFILKFGLVGAFISQIFLYFFTLLGLLIGYEHLSSKYNHAIAKEIGTYSLIYGLSVIGYYIFAKIDVLILGYFGFLKEVATYELLNKIFWVMLFPFAIVGQVVAPNFARYKAIGDFKKILNKTKKYTVIFFILAAIFSIILYFAAPIIVVIFFPIYDNEIFKRILPLAVSIFFINVAASSIDSGIIVPTGYALIMSKAYLVLALTNIVTAVLFLYIFGYIGVIIATLASSLIMILYVRITYYKIIYKLNLS